MFTYPREGVHDTTFLNTRLSTILRFSVALLKQTPIFYIKLGHNCFFPHPFQLIVVLQYEAILSELLHDYLCSNTIAVRIKFPAMASKTGSIEVSTHAQILITNSVLKYSGYNIKHIHHIIQCIIPKSENLK
jgi:hypothetical protein